MWVFSYISSRTSQNWNVKTSQETTLRWIGCHGVRGTLRYHLKRQMKWTTVKCGLTERTARVADDAESLAGKHRWQHCTSFPFRRAREPNDSFCTANSVPVLQKQVGTQSYWAETWNLKLTMCSIRAAMFTSDELCWRQTLERKLRSHWNVTTTHGGSCVVRGQDPDQLSRQTLNSHRKISIAPKSSCHHVQLILN